MSDGRLDGQEETAARVEALLAAERAARDRAIAEAVDQALAKEREAREEALAAQEHRASVATVNLVAALVRKQWEKLPTRAGAFVFAALMRPGAAAAVGLVALATLALTAVQVVLLSRQNELLEAQNARVDIQTAVAEAGRRADLAREARQVIAEMIAERERTIAASPRQIGTPGPGEAPDRWGYLECVPPDDPGIFPELCWRAFRRSSSEIRRNTGEGGAKQHSDTRMDALPHPMPARCLSDRPTTRWSEARGCPLPERPSTRLLAQGASADRLRSEGHVLPAPPAWYPSAGLSARLASLTRGLAPHRPVIVDDGDVECEPQGDDMAVLNGVLHDRGDTDYADAARRALVNTVRAPPPPSPPPSWAWTFVTRAAGMLSPQRVDTAPIDFPPKVRFSCVAGSPERGDILLAMLDAGLHPDSVTGRGGDFTGALLRAVELRNRVLEGVRLSGARFAATSERRSPDGIPNWLEDVVFHYVDLGGADMRMVGMRGVLALTRWTFRGAVFGPESLSHRILDDPLVIDLVAAKEPIQVAVPNPPRDRVWGPIATMCPSNDLQALVGATEEGRVRFAFLQKSLRFLIARYGPLPAAGEAAAPARGELMLVGEALLGIPDASVRLVDTAHRGTRIVVEQLRLADCAAVDTLPRELREPVTLTPPLAR